jgi:hypothetical protein
LVQKGGRKGYITDRNGSSSWEGQGIVTFCTCQWNEWINENALTELFSNSTSVRYKCSISKLLQFLTEIHFKFLFPLDLILYNFKTAPPSEVCYQHNTFFWLIIYLLAVTPLKNIKHWAVPNLAIWKTGHQIYSVKGMLF